jgi:hypothetical protein
MNDQSTSPRDAHTALSAPQLRPGGLKYQVSSDKKDESRINERTLEKWEQATNPEGRSHRLPFESMNVGFGILCGY